MPAAYDSDTGSTTLAPQKRKRLKKKPAPKYKVTVPDKDESTRSRRSTVPTPDQADRARTPVQKKHDKVAVRKSVGESRQKAVAKQGSLSITRAVKRELEGKGLVAHTLSDVAERRVRQDPGGFRIASAAPVSGDIGANAMKDLISLPAEVVPSIYVPVAGAYEAARGRPERLKRFVEDAKQSDPVYNAAAAGVEKLRGNDEAAESHWHKAKKAAEEHPLNTALEVYGVGKGLDAAAGKVARSGALGGRAKRAAATEGAPKTVPGTNITEPRKYPKGPIQKATKLYQEKTAREKAADLRAHADEVRDHDPDAARQFDAEANRADPDRVQSGTLTRPGEIRRRVDERVDANEMLRRIGRGEVQRDVENALKGIDSAQRPLVSLIAQRIVRPDADDIREYVRDLEREHADLEGADRRANEELRSRINRALRQPGRLGDVAAAADRYADVMGPLQRQLVERGMLDADQAEKAAHIPYAVRRMGATHTAEHNRRAAQEAKETRDNVQARVDRLEVERDQLKATHRTERGRDAMTEPQAAHFVGEVRFDRRADAEAYVREHGGQIKTRALTLSESKRRGKAAQVERALRNARKELADANATHRAAHERRNVAELVDEDGRPLSTEQIREHMRDSGEREPAFITQARNQRGARSFNIRPEVAQAIGGRRRTGEATRKGTFDIHADTLTENAARARGLADATTGFRAFVQEFGARGSSGKVKTVQTRAQADRVLAELNAIRGGHEFRVVRIQPWGGRREQLQSLLDDADSEAQFARGSDESPITVAMQDALRGEGDGPFAFVPAEAADHVMKHLRTMGPGAAGKAGQLAFQAFRNTVLSTSPTWLAGNVIEGAFRTALNRAGVRSYVTGRRVLNRIEEIDQHAGHEAAARTVSGGHLSSAQRRTLHRSAEQFTGTRLEGTANALGKFWRSPGPKQAAQLWNAWTHLVMDQISGTIERGYQTAILGAELRRSPLMDGHLRKLSGDAIHDAARGLRNTNAQVEFGRAVDRAYGRYNKLGPTERAVMATYTPFVRWSVNAAQFIVDVLPRDHPVVTALIVSAENATEEWRKEKGLSKFIDGALPDFLQGSIPTGDGHLRLSRYTPFSLATDPLDTAAGQVLPQLNGALMAARGLDFKGDKLKGRDGGDPDDYDKALAVVHAIAQATIPGLSQGERVAAKGAGALNPFAPAKSSSGGGGRVKVPGAYSAPAYDSPTSTTGAYASPLGN